MVLLGGAAEAGPVSGHLPDAERERWLAHPIIRRISEMNVPLWVGDLACAYLLAMVLWGWA